MREQNDNDICPECRGQGYIQVPGPSCEKLYENCKSCRATGTISGGAEGNEHLRRSWLTPCEVCSGVPILVATGLCGVCMFGEAECAGGNW